MNKSSSSRSRDLTTIMGIAGLVVSLIGIAVKGWISPLGIGLSVAAMNKRMSIVSILGVVIGLGGMIWLFDVSFTKAERPMRPKPSDPVLMRAETQLGRICGWLKVYDGYNGKYPTTSEGFSVLPDAKEPPVDPWDNSIRYTRLDSFRCEVRSFGPDGMPDTPDDLDNVLEREHSTNPIEPKFWIERMVQVISTIVLFLVGLIGGGVLLEFGQN